MRLMIVISMQAVITLMEIIPALVMMDTWEMDSGETALVSGHPK